MGNLGASEEGSRKAKDVSQSLSPDGEGPPVLSGRPLRNIFSNCVSSSACRNPGRSRSARHRIHLREIDSEDRRPRRLCRCLEAALFRLGIQGQAQKSGGSVRAAEAIRRLIREPAAADCLAGDPGPHHFTNAIAQQHVIALGELRSFEARNLLRNCSLTETVMCSTSSRTPDAAPDYCDQSAIPGDLIG
jgi:hypothetical protein